MPFFRVMNHRAPALALELRQILPVRLEHLVEQGLRPVEIYVLKGTALNTRSVLIQVYTSTGASRA
jgi:hypothetical protein